MNAKISQFPKQPAVKNGARSLRPPGHLSTKMKRWWLSVVQEFELEEHHLLILTKAAEAHDRGEQARRILAKRGLTFEDRFGQPCSRPEIAIERDSRIQFARLVRELALSEDEPGESRPPKLKYGGK